MPYAWGKFFSPPFLLLYHLCKNTYSILVFRGDFKVYPSSSVLIKQPNTYPHFFFRNIQIRTSHFVSEYETLCLPLDFINKHLYDALIIYNFDSEKNKCPAYTKHSHENS